MVLDYEAMAQERYTGIVYEVLISIYEDDEPYFEEGTIEQEFFDDESEAKDFYVSQIQREDLYDFFNDYADVPEYDTVGVFLLERTMNTGFFADTYFTDDIKDMFIVKR